MRMASDAECIAHANVYRVVGIETRFNTQMQSTPDITVPTASLMHLSAVVVQAFFECREACDS